MSLDSETPSWLSSIHTQLFNRDIRESLPFNEIISANYNLRSELAISKYQAASWAHRIEYLEKLDADNSLTTIPHSPSVGLSNSVPSTPMSPHPLPSPATPSSLTAAMNYDYDSKTKTELVSFVNQLNTKYKDAVEEARVLDLRVKNDEILLCNINDRHNLLKKQHLKLKEDHEQLLGYKTAIESTLAKAKNNMRDYEVMQRKISDLEILVAELTTELHGVRKEAALGFNIADQPNMLGSEDLDRRNVSWHIKTKAEVPNVCKLNISAHQQQASVCKYDANGSLVLTSGGDGIIRCFKSRTGEKGFSSRLSSHSIISFDLSSNADSVCFGGSEKKIGVWKLMDRHPPVTTTLTNECISTGFLTDTKIACAIKSRVDCLSIYDWQSDNKSLSTLHTITCDSSPTTMATGSMTSHLATGHFDKSLKIWAVGTSNIIPLLETQDLHDQRITNVSFNTGIENTIVTSSWDGLLKLIDVRSGKVTTTINGYDKGYLNKQEYTGCKFSPDGRYIVAGDNNGRLYVWDLNNTENPYIVSSPNVKKVSPSGINAGEVAIMNVDWNPNGRQICAVDRSGYLSFYEYNGVSS